MCKKYAIVREHQEQHSDGTHGEGYTSRFNVIKEFDDIEKLKQWVSDNHSAKFKAYELTELSVKTTIKVQVDIQ